MYTSTYMYPTRLRLHPPAHPADAEDEARLAGAHAHEAEAQLPVEPVLADEGDERQRHGGAQHVEDPGHVVHVQLAGHHLVLLVVTDARQPLGLQFLHLAWKRSTTGACGFVFAVMRAFCSTATDALHARIFYFFFNRRSMESEQKMLFAMQWWLKKKHFIGLFFFSQTYHLKKIPNHI